MGPVPWGGSCEGEKLPAPWEGSSPVEKLDWTEGEFWSLKGENSNQFVEAKTKNNLHRGLAQPSCVPHPERLLCQ